MQHPKIVIVGLGLAPAAAGAVTATVATASPSHSTPSASATQGSGTAAAAVRTARALVGGRTETILVNSAGLPLYYCQPDTAARSLVSGGLAAAWPPVTGTTPAGAGLSGQLTVVRDAHGSQLAYNGHLLYTFVTDRPGQVPGQGVQNFFVVTPGIAPIAGSSAPTPNGPATSSGGGYGY